MRIAFIGIGLEEAKSELSQPTLVLIPGLLSDEIVWEDVIARLGDVARIVVADLSRQDSIADMARDALAANPGQLWLAGHSMGARVALEMLRLAPERIDKLALLDTGVHPRKDGEGARRQVLVDLGFQSGMAELAAQWLPPMVHPDRHGDVEMMSALTAMVERMTPHLHERQIKALLGRPDAEPMLPEIDCPTLLVVGRQDAWSPLAQHEAMLPKLKHGRLVVIEDAGHFAPIEQPQAVAAALADWAQGWH